MRFENLIEFPTSSLSLIGLIEVLANIGAMAGCLAN